MSRTFVHASSPGSVACRAFGSGFRLAVAAGLIGGLIAGAGCKTKTLQQEIDEHIKRQRAEEANMTAEEIEVARKAADDLQRRVTREGLARDIQQQRLKLRNDALLAIEQGEWTKALRIVRQIYGENTPAETTIELSDGSPEVIRVDPPAIEDTEKAQLFVILGTAYYKRGNEGDAGRAITAFEEATQLDPSLSDARRNFGKLLFADQQYRRALEVFAAELASGGHDADLLFLVAQARYEVFHKEGMREPGQREAARIAMEQVLVERPEDPDVQRWLAYLNLESGRHDEAIRLLEAILDAHPFDPEYNQMLANAYREKGDNAKALERLEIAARFKTPTPNMCKSLADYYASQSRPEEAAIWLEKAYEEDPSQMPAEDHLYVGQLYAEAGRINEALAHFESVKDDAPQYPEAQSQLAWLFEDLGRDDDALAAYANVVRARPQDGQAHLAAADIYLGKKQLDKALDAYAKAAALPKTKADGLAGLAEVAYEKDDLEGAVKHYQEALEARPKDPRFVTALREINAQLQMRRQQTD